MIKMNEEQIINEIMKDGVMMQVGSGSNQFVYIATHWVVTSCLPLF